MNKENVIGLLTSTKEQTLVYFDLEDNLLQKTYGQDKWNIRQILHHLADSEHIFLERLKRIIAGPRQVIWAYDGDMWNSSFNYVDEPLKNKKQLYELCREMNKELVEKYYDTVEINFVHSEAGIRSLKEEFARVATHNLSHIEQMQKAAMS